MATGFEQAGIKVEHEAEFSALKQSIQRLLSPALIEKFFKKLDRKDIRIRQFENLLAARVMEEIDVDLAKSGKSSQSLYDALSMSDKGQMREFYLTSIEQVDANWRHKFQKLYSYY